ncbi:hypothetical protein RB653_006817 [Dictyostelium firmibasis]|uniref:Uncharacterized protein n=1 Tax=Dictyostelium firmibasis TaxID=79012 RepID=A0AAN7TMD7_9MYCE
MKFQFQLVIKQVELNSIMNNQLLQAVQ